MLAIQRTLFITSIPLAINNNLTFGNLLFIAQEIDVMNRVQYI